MVQYIALAPAVHGIKEQILQRVFGETLSDVATPE